MKKVGIIDVLNNKISGEWGTESEKESGVGVIRTANFTNLGYINFDSIVYRKISEKKIENKKLMGGDIIIEKSGGSPKQPVGRVVYFENPDNKIYLCNNFTAILRANRKKVFPKYLFYILFNNHKIKKTLKYQNKTTGIINLKLDNYLNSKIPIPESYDDQVRIAGILSRAERLIAKRKESIRLLDEFLKSTFLEMFGDPKCNPKKFPIYKLKEFYIDSKNGTKCGPFGSALKKEEYVKQGIPVWNMDNISLSGRMIKPFRMWITSEKYKLLKSYTVIDGDVIISRAGTVGKMCVAKISGEKSIISTNLIRVRFGEKIQPNYFVSLMNYCKGRVGRLKTGPDGAFTHMNTGILDSLSFPYPPLPLQKQFAPIVEKIEAIKIKYQASLEELKNLYGSLSQRAFIGELDLSRVPVERAEIETV